MKQLFPKILSHVAAWLAFLAIPFFLTPPPPGNRPPTPPNEAPEFIRTLFFVSLNLALIGFFYLNYFVLIPKLWTRERRWAYFASVLSCFILLKLWLSVLILGILPQFAPETDMHMMEGMATFASFLLFNLTWATSSGIRLSLEWKRAEERRRESESAQLSAELNQLKSQLNPHFLFNTLNGIYTLALAKNEAAPDAVLKLSHLLRYVMAETGSDFVPLQNDLEHLTHFVDLHKMRLTAQTPVTFTIEGNPALHQIAPLLLLPFVENAFKFGTSTLSYSPIQLNIKITDTQIEFHCQNHVRSNQTDSTGIGIANTRRRLELLYPERFDLQITENQDIFSVFLLIQV